MINIIFVKHGDKYSAEHVNVLHKQLLVYYPAANYYCYTDDPVGVSISIIPIFKKPSLRKWWNKLALFSEAMPFKGKCLYFDLDMDVISDPTSFIQDFDGLTNEWGKSNYVNPPFGSIIHQGKKKGATAWVRKAIAENEKGKDVVFVFPIDKWILMLVKAGAEIRNLGDVKWLATEDKSQGKGLGRHIACFVLKGKK